MVGSITLSLSLQATFEFHNEDQGEASATPEILDN